MPHVERWQELVFIIIKGKGYIEEKMTEVQLKKILRQLHAAQIHDSLIEECLTLSESNHTVLQYSDSFQFRIIEETLNILSQNEKFIIETHLVYHHTWTETSKLFSESNGENCERSERTLKRIQSRALKKMVDFINRSPLKDCFSET